MTWLLERPGLACITVREEKMLRAFRELSPEAQRRLLAAVEAERKAEAAP